MAYPSLAPDVKKGAGFPSGGNIQMSPASRKAMTPSEDHEEIV